MLSSLKRTLQCLRKSSLPEQRYYSIDELLLRWKSDGVTFQQLCDGAEHENFVMGVRVRDTTNLSEQFQRADGVVVTRTASTLVLAGYEERPPIRTDYLDAYTLVKILTAAPAVKVQARTTYPTIAREASSGPFNLHAGNYYSKEDLVVR